MSRLIIVPYKMGSASCKALKEALVANGVHALQVKPDSRKFRPRRTDKYLYYGGTSSCNWMTPLALNTDRQLATNKLYTLRVLTEAHLFTVEWTMDKTVAATWPTTVARATLTGHSGQGITIHQQGEPLPTVPLYTKYMKKTFECRIHVMNGKVIDGQIKKKRANAEETNTLVRNIHTGWVYCREGYTPAEEAKQLAIAAVAALGLDFGAVDLIYNQYYNQYYILECNTAPGLTGTTLNNYVQELISWLH